MQDILQRNQESSLTEMGTDMIKSGLIEQGSKLLTAAASAGEKIALTDKAKADTSLKQTESNLKQIEMFQNMVTETHDQDGFNKAVQRAEQMGVKIPPGLKNATWSPELKSQLELQGATWKDRQTAALNAQREASLEAERAGREKSRKLTDIRTAAQIKETEARTVKLEKNDGANSASKPNSQLLKSSDAMVKAEFPDMSSTERANTSAYITSQAQAAMMKNKGLDWESALNQEYSKIKPDIKTERHLFGKDDVKFNRPQDKPITPKVTPKPPDAGTVKEGYRFKGGNPADKANWEAV
jgi:hypothetical protein